MNEELYYFRKLDNSKWNELIYNVLNYKALDYPLKNEFDTAEKYLINIDTILKKGKEDKVLKLYHQSLFEYYFNLRIIETNYFEIYSLHSVFSAIKSSQFNYINKLVLQFTSEDLSGHFFDNIDLEASLLLVLGNLEIKDKTVLEAAIFQNILNKHKQYSLYRIALRFFIKSGDYLDQGLYFALIEKLLSQNSNDERLNSVLFKSLYELRDRLGSFLVISRWLFKNLDRMTKEYPTSSKMLFSSFDEVLNYSASDFKSDVNAKLIKIILNKDICMPCLILKDLLESSSQQDQINSILKYIINYQTKNGIINFTTKYLYGIADGYSIGPSFGLQCDEDTIQKIKYSYNINYNIEVIYQTLTDDAYKKFEKIILQRESILEEFELSSN
jgi:hypothetical protein